MASVFKVNRGHVFKYTIFRKKYLRFIFTKCFKSANYIDWSKVIKLKNTNSHSLKFSKRPHLYCFYSGRFRSVVRPVQLTRMVFKYFAYNVC